MDTLMTQFCLHTLIVHLLSTCQSVTERGKEWKVTPSQHSLPYITSHYVNITIVLNTGMTKCSARGFKSCVNQQILRL